MKKDFISVIMPTYNRGYVISRAIDSILNQSIKNFELIIIDDCSTDDTEKIVKKYDDNRIVYIKLEKNSGANFARNEGLKRAKGNYITFQDSDDYSFETRLETELNTLKKKNVDWVFTSFMKIDGQKKQKIPRKKIDSNEIKEKIMYGNFVTTQVLFAKREVFENIKFDSMLPRFQDWDLVIRISKEYKGFHIDEVYLNMYLQNDSITKKPGKGAKALEMLLEKYNTEFSDKQKSKIYCRIGIFKMLNNESAKYYFKKSIELDKNLKYKIIYLLYKFNLLKKVYLIIKK